MDENLDEPWYINHEGILLISEKEQSSDTHNFMDESPGYYTEWKKTIPKVYMLYDFIDVIPGIDEILENTNWQ